LQKKGFFGGILFCAMQEGLEPNGRIRLYRQMWQSRKAVRLCDWYEYHK